MPRLIVPFETLVSSWREVADSGHFTEGKYVRALEEEVADWSNQYAIACNSCGSGLFMVASQFPAGTAIIPNNTFAATAFMLEEAGWDVVLADCSFDDFSLTPETILNAYAGCKNRSEITAVVLTHVGGGLALKYREIADLCRSRGWFLFEDAAHALGTTNKEGLIAGQLGTAAVFSLYPTKAIPAGEGGVVVTNEPILAKEVRQYRNYGKHKKNGVLAYDQGFNFRMDEWTAVVAYHQFKARHDIIAERCEIANKLARVVAPMLTWDGYTNWYKFVVGAGYPAKRQTGKIYANSDQMCAVLDRSNRPFPVSRRVAISHICLPAEGLPENVSTETLDGFLRGAL